MNQFSYDYMKTLIEIGNEINSDFSNKDALLFRILKSAMRLINCDVACFVTALSGVVPFKLVSFVQQGEYKVLDKDLTGSSIALLTAEEKKPLIVNNVGESSYYYQFVTFLEPLIVENLISIPVYSNGKLIAVIECMNSKSSYGFTDSDNALGILFAEIVANALDNCKKYSTDKGSEKNYLNPSLIHEFISVSPIVNDLLSMVKKMALTQSAVLITGESGVGKELFAEQVFINSKRANKPFVRVNCAALSQTLMESELFGHEKGAYTSADSMQKGRFELADGGTIFLDEVGEIPLPLQAKLLRVIQDKQFERVGSSNTMSVDVRIIAATNRNLEEMVRQGKFREDLYFRLNVLPVRVPPLRRRVEDILPLANFFLKKACNDSGKTIYGFSEDAILALKEYNWPGNVRELDNVVSRACVIAEGTEIQKNDLFFETSFMGASDTAQGNLNVLDIIGLTSDSDRTLKNALYQFKRSYLIQILNECKWNQTKAGYVLGIQRTYVSRLMNELHIREK